MQVENRKSVFLGGWLKERFIYQESKIFLHFKHLQKVVDFL